MSDHGCGESVLFLSSDVIGSTAYKQRNVDTWRRTFLSFYWEFPQALQAVSGSGSKFSLWKPIGDELIFTHPVRSEADVFDAVRTWIEAMAFYEAETLKKHQLSTKGGAFIATFPGPDSRCAIPRTFQEGFHSDKSLVSLNNEALSDPDPSAYHFDYFGPSIDTGFRVIANSNARHFTLSVEVAAAMIRCQHDATGDDKRHFHQQLDDLVLLKTSQLKGVWGDREYPLFAVDRESEDLYNTALRDLDGPTTDLLPKYSAIASACLKDDNWPSRLYLPDSTHEPFTDRPPDALESIDDNKMDGSESEASGGLPPATGGVSDAPVT